MRQQVWISTNEKKVSSSSHTQAHKHTQYTHMNARIDRMWAVCCCTDAYVCVCECACTERRREQRRTLCAYIVASTAREFGLFTCTLNIYSIHQQWHRHHLAAIRFFICFFSLLTACLKSSSLRSSTSIESNINSRATIAGVNKRTEHFWMQ